MLRINDEAPNFTAETSQGTINFHEWMGDGWAILFSHPKDFTPVCTTELGYMAGLQPEFEKRNCKIIGLSVDPVTSHSKWAADIEETQGHKVNYPMIGDPELKVAKLYDMLPADAGDYLRRPHRRHQRHRAHRVRRRPRQEDQADAQLPDEHRPQLRRSAARGRFDAAHRQAQSGHAGELEAGRRRDHPPRGFRRRSQAEVSRTAGNRPGLICGSFPSRTDCRAIHEPATRMVRSDPQAILSAVPGARFLPHRRRGDRHGSRR